MTNRYGRPQSLAAIFSGYIDPAPRPEYRGVVMRSRLETAFAAHLDSQGEEWTYEPAIYGGYLPDFEIVHGVVPVFIEVKPTLREVPKAKRRMRAIWRHRPEAMLIVACAEQCRWFVATRGRPWVEFVERWAHGIQVEVH